MLAMDEATYYTEGGTEKPDRWDTGMGAVLGGPTSVSNPSLD
jgi:hypothetical protein